MLWRPHFIQTALFFHFKGLLQYFKNKQIWYEQPCYVFSLLKWILAKLVLVTNSSGWLYLSNHVLYCSVIFFLVGFYLCPFFFFLIIIPIEGLWSRWVLQNYKWIAYRISNLDCKCTWHFETKTQPVLLRNRSLLSPKGGVRLGITPAELTVNVVLPMISQNYYFCANRFNFFYWLLFMSKGICPCNWCFAAYQHYMCFFKKANVVNCIAYCSRWRKILETPLRQWFDGQNRECSNLEGAELGPHTCL